MKPKQLDEVTNTLLKCYEKKKPTDRNELSKREIREQKKRDKAVGKIIKKERGK